MIFQVTVTLLHEVYEFIFMLMEDYGNYEW